MKTTLNAIRKHDPCPDGWKKLLLYLGKTQADDEPLSIATVLDSNGLDDALWCLRAVDGFDREKRLFAVWCARQAQHLMADERSIRALDVAEAYANGRATDSDLAAARAAAWAAAEAARAAAMAAASDAAEAARAAAWAAAEATMAAAWAATRAATRAAARAATRAAARAAASDATGGAAQAAQAQRLREVISECDAAMAAKENG